VDCGFLTSKALILAGIDIATLLLTASTTAFEPVSESFGERLASAKPLRFVRWILTTSAKIGPPLMYDVGNAPEVYALTCVVRV